MKNIIQIDNDIYDLVKAEMLNKLLIRGSESKMADVKHDDKIEIVNKDEDDRLYAKVVSCKYIKESHSTEIKISLY